MSRFSGQAKNFVEGQFSTPPAGSHPAVLVAMIDLGEQEDDYSGERKWSQKIYLVWELVSEPINPNENHVIGLMCTLSFSSKSKLRGIVEKWRGRAMTEGEEFDPAVMLGKPCLVTITEVASGDKRFAKWDGLMPLPKGMDIAKPKHAQLLLDNCQSIDTKDLPAWLPYIYGQKVGAVVEAGRRNKNTNQSNDKPKEDDSSIDPWTREAADIPF